MKSIEIGPEVDQILCEHGKFGETYNDVLLKLLKTTKQKESKEKPKNTLLKVPESKKLILQNGQKKNCLPLILHALYTYFPNQEGKCCDVVDFIRDSLPPLANGQDRAKNKICWTRDIAVIRGLLLLIENSDRDLGKSPTTERGIWKLSPLGIKVAEFLHKKGEEINETS